MSESNARPVLATVASFVSLVSLGGVAALGLNLAGIPIMPRQDVAPAAVTATVDPRTVLVSKDAPAALAINKVMAGDKVLIGRGQVTEGGSPALPYSCPVGSSGPTYSASRNMSFKGSRINVVAGAYTAGYGAIAFTEFREAARSCANGIGTVAGWNESIGSAPAYVTDFRQSGGSTRTMMVRHGDAILHIRGPQDKVRAAATQALKLLEAGNACAAPLQGASVFTRNPLAGESYVGRFENEVVKLDAPEPPLVPADSKYPALTQDTKLPAQPHSITPAATPDYPVYPDMPQKMEVPVKPSAPADPDLESTVKVHAQDKQGPGCGWSYTGSPGPLWEAKKALKANTETIEEAASLLADGIEQWEQETLDYWKSAAAYQKAVKKYLAYSDDVKTVNAAWAVIADQWSQYRAVDAAYAAREESIAAFHRDKEAATTQYATDLATCEAALLEPAAPTVEPTPAEPGSEENLAVEPEPAAEIIPCVQSVKKPAILDQLPLDSLTKPTPPADPRPAVTNEGA